MCGIVGALAFREGSDPVETLPPLISRMARRGPDDEGSWSDGRLCAGFAGSRSSIQSDGHQPMLTVDGSASSSSTARSTTFAR
jgi:asparagine synthase (glutamine-hydrolysing)